MTESSETWTELCSKFTGSIDGRAVVTRGCFQGVRELIGLCTRDAFLEIEDRNATDVLGCFCSGDRCNGASDGVQFTYLSLIAITLHVIYKFVTA